METKLFELRDSATFIPVLAIKLKSRTEVDRWILARGGFAPQDTYVVLMSLTRMKCEYDPLAWSRGGRTYPVAHEHIRENWESLESGAVVDVELILGETKEIKVSERLRDN